MIANTRDIKFDKMRMLIYGQSNVGKTALALTCPRPLILASEDGLLTLSTMDMPYEIIKTANDIEKIIIGKNMDNYDSIYIDSLSEMSTSMLLSAKQRYTDPRRAYLEISDEIIDMIGKLKTLNKHVFMTAHEIFTKTGDDSVVYTPSLAGEKLSQKIAYYFDAVMRMKIQQCKQTGKMLRLLQTISDHQAVAKIRVPWGYELPDHIPADINALINWMSSLPKFN